MYTATMLPAKVGIQSLLHIMTDKRPVPWGNYFWLDAGKTSDSQYRVVNMWAENLIHAIQFLGEDKTVRCLVWDCGMQRGKYVLIQDPRIPEEYYYNKLCFTGNWPPDVPTAKEMYEIVGDPEGELEQFTDPKSYHAKRGREWVSANSTGISTTTKAPIEITHATGEFVEFLGSSKER